MTAAELKGLRLAMHDPQTGEPPTQKVAAAIMGVAYSTYFHWEQKQPIPPMAARLASRILKGKVREVYDDYYPALADLCR